MSILQIFTLILIVIGAILIINVAKRLIKAAFYIALFLIVLIVVGSFMGFQPAEKLKQGAVKITGYVIGAGKEKAAGLAEDGIDKAKNYIASEIKD